VTAPAGVGMTFDEQMDAVGRYLIDRGYKPGMDRTQLYSTINAGRPGLAHLSDANNGGAPGTVADKVRDQMAAHEVKARALLGGSLPAGSGNTAVATSTGAQPAAPGPTSPLPDVGAPDRGILSPAVDPFKAIADAAKERQDKQMAELAASTAPQVQAPAPPPAPVAPPPAPVDYTGLLLPRIKRGLLADDYSSGLLGAA